MPPKFGTINPHIRKMIREDTGSHMLDSGMIYGYNYDRPLPEKAVYPVSYKGDNDEPVIEWHQVSLGHFLTHNLRIDARLTRSLRHFANRSEWKREPWETVLEAWSEANGFGVDSGGNTYSIDNPFDQGFAFWNLTLPDDTSRTIIRSHNGCDARGGYSAPRIFFSEESEYGGPWHGSADLYYYCPGCQDDFEPTEGTLTEGGAVCPKCGKDGYVDCYGLEW